MTEQTKPAQWRGEVKVQIELGVPSNQAHVMITSKDGSICAIFPSNKAIRRILNGRPKIYCKATLLGDGTIDVRQEVPDRSW